ncbi:MAG TPA: response regulator [Aggregatilinea sp.]|jgi:CheY-like chemotaxis protein|uniref:response regulator n=1 Tax=Aggregatilinea sp. TaxID=2806333 RepID=UPI002B631183|nr:response regulator [Aggregatilinea sp.]HML22748.1 response regulator [Aggregatilinea sp.]
MNIIYVEDDPGNIQLVQRLTRSTGDLLLTFPDAESALASDAIWNADLILMDIRLPGKINGLDMTGMLRQHGLNVPVIMITAYDLPDYVERYRDVGADLFLIKPVSVPELVDVLNEYRV